MQKLRDTIVLGCDEQVSRLTGSLIANTATHAAILQRAY